MRVIREYKRAESLEEAWQLNQKKSNRVLGGMVWLKMGKMQIGTAIDLSSLGLDTIEETGEEFRIGCMVTLRDLELDPGLNSYTDGAARESVRHIVGVQFRNLATVGGSIYGRYGFSDVLTMFSRDFQERFFSFSIKSKSSGSCSARGTRPGYGVSVWSEDGTAVANPALMAG